MYRDISFTIKSYLKQVSLEDSLNFTRNASLLRLSGNLFQNVRFSMHPHRLCGLIVDNIMISDWMIQAFGTTVWGTEYGTDIVMLYR